MKSTSAATTTTNSLDHLVDIYVLTIAVHFTRYIQRDRKRKWGWKEMRHLSMNFKSLMFLSKMADAFLGTIGLMLELEVETFWHWDQINHLLSYFTWNWGILRGRFTTSTSVNIILITVRNSHHHNNFLGKHIMFYSIHVDLSRTM